MPDEPRDDKDLKRLPTEEELERQLRDMGFDEADEDPSDLSDPSDESDQSDTSDPTDDLPPLNPAPEMSVPPHYPEAQPPETEDEFELRLRQIDERIGETRRTHAANAAQIDREFDDKVDDLEARAQRTKEEREAKKRDAARKGIAARNDAKGLGVGVTIAYTIIGLPLAGAGLGWLLDRAMGTTFWTAVCLLVGGVLGVAMAVMMVNRTYKDK